MTPWAAARVNAGDRAIIAERESELGVKVGAAYSARHREWCVSVTSRTVPSDRLSLRARGSLPAIIAGALDDWAAR